jgi:glycosyltransferase involved in cell wall biosynthesis
LSHRLPLGIAAKDRGYEVHVAAALDPELDQRTRDTLENFGLVLHQLRFSRRGASPVELVRDFFDLCRLYRAIKPDIVHLVALKPVLLGGLAAKACGISRVILAVPGRGSVFSASGPMATFRRWVALAMYRFAYARQRNRVIIQNAEDREYFLKRRIFSESDVRLIRGSGVDPTKFVPVPEPESSPVVIFASRMLREKGVEDFVNAARHIRAQGGAARFVLVGDPDPGNPHSHSREELETWATEGAVEWWGYREDMNQVFAQAHVVCLPTYYGEGVPKVLIEAAACARPIVTTDIPGCRDIVRHEENGLLVKPRDVMGIVCALERILGDKQLRERMGQRGREIVEREFSLRIVTEQTLSIYSELLW